MAHSKDYLELRSNGKYTIRKKQIRGKIYYTIDYETFSLEGGSVGSGGTQYRTRQGAKKAIKKMKKNKKEKYKNMMWEYLIDPLKIKANTLPSHIDKKIDQSKLASFYEKAKNESEKIKLKENLDLEIIKLIMNYYINGINAIGGLNYLKTLEEHPYNIHYIHFPKNILKYIHEIESDVVIYSNKPTSQLKKQIQNIDNILVDLILKKVDEDRKKSKAYPFIGEAMLQEGRYEGKTYFVTSRNTGEIRNVCFDKKEAEDLRSHWDNKDAAHSNFVAGFKLIDYWN